MPLFKPAIYCFASVPVQATFFESPIVTCKNSGPRQQERHNLYVSLATVNSTPDKHATVHALTNDTALLFINIAPALAFWLATLIPNSHISYSENSITRKSNHFSNRNRRLMLIHLLLKQRNIFVSAKFRLKLFVF